jgi:hypothetical protein
MNRLPGTLAYAATRRARLLARAINLVDGIAQERADGRGGPLGASRYSARDAACQTDENQQRCYGTTPEELRNMQIALHRRLTVIATSDQHSCVGGALRRRMPQWMLLITSCIGSSLTVRIPEQAARDSGMMPPTHSEIIPPVIPR